MLQTSGTYNFQSIEIELFIREAYERIGIIGEFTEPQKLEAAKRSIDFLLLEWMSKTVNLWTLETSFLPLVQGKTSYILDNTVSDMIQIHNRKSIRQLNGVASSTAGDAALAFDGNNNTSCIQNVAAAVIGYDYGAGNSQTITFIGINSETTATTTISVEVSQDNVNWTPLFDIPSQTYNAGYIYWFDVPVPQSARAYRIRNVVSLNNIFNIRELYFNNNVIDIDVSLISRNEYYCIPNKKALGSPNSYYFDRQIQPILNIWPAPSNLYNCLFYSYKKMIQDTGSFYTNGLQIPSRFYQALIWGLSWMLAIKYKPEAAAMMQAEYEKSFALAQNEDSELTPMRIYPNYFFNGY